MGGGGGGMGGLMNMILPMLMKDPELAAGLQNPKIMAALQKVMGDPSILMGGTGSPQAQELLKDPEIKAFVEKLQAKLGPLLGAMGGGMGGGMPGG